MTGTIKTLTDKGYGFISIPGSRKDMFFHARELNGIRYEDLREGDEVQFETEEGEKGVHAVNVQLIEG